MPRHWWHSAAKHPGWSTFLGWLSTLGARPGAELDVAMMLKREWDGYKKGWEDAINKRFADGGYQPVMPAGIVDTPPEKLKPPLGDTCLSR